jgi:UDP-galactopyranose mutase
VQRLNVALLELQLRVLRGLLGFHRVIFWSYMPQMVSIGRKLKAARIVYFRTDDYTALPGVPVDLIRLFEEDAVRQADLSIGVAKRYVAGALADARKTLWLPNGVELARFFQAAPDGRPRSEVSLLMVGTLDSWLAVEMLQGVAEARPKWTITFAGPVRTDLQLLLELPNVTHLGVVPYDEVPQLMAAADVGLVPFRIGAIAEGATPGKLFQYLAAGRPVVATRAVDPPEDLRPFIRLINEDPDELIRAVEKLIKDERPGDVERRRAAVRNHSWKRRFESVERALGIAEDQ